MLLSSARVLRVPATAAACLCRRAPVPFRPACVLTATSRRLADIAAVHPPRPAAQLAPLATPAPVTLPPPAMLDPLATMDKMVATAAVRADRPLGEMMASAFLGGSYLAFGGCLYVLVAGGSAVVAAAAPGVHALMSALVFPAGLSLIVMTGADLLTSNMMYGVLPFLTHPGRALARKVADLAKLWAVSFAGNALGSLFIASCAAAWIFLPGTPGAAFVAAVAAKKCALPLTALLGKAAGANWLVNLALFQATTATSTAGKMAGLWMPVTMFVALGLEHSVANMFLLPLGKLCGAEITWLEDIVLGNLLPVCLGNAIGAGVFVAGLSVLAGQASGCLERHGGAVRAFFRYRRRGMSSIR